MKLLYIDACVRENESRTLRIAEPIIEKLSHKYNVERLILNDLKLSVIQKDLFNKRAHGEIDQETLKWAYMMKEADRVVIAAPFWDMSIPACLKVFIELISLLDITFKSDDKTCYGNCNAEKMLLITTRGMNITTGDPLEQATPYLKALSHLWGIKSLEVIDAYNMDYVSEEEVNKKIQAAILKGLELCNNF